MNDKYTLDDSGNPAPESDLLKWAQWFKTANRHVAQEQIGDSIISTVFLGFGHSFSGGVSSLWETMVFGGILDQEQDRCGGSRKNAEDMHAAMVQRVKTWEQSPNESPEHE